MSKEKNEKLTMPLNNSRAALRLQFTGDAEAARVADA